MCWEKELLVCFSELLLSWLLACIFRIYIWIKISFGLPGYYCCSALFSIGFYITNISLKDNKRLREGINSLLIIVAIF